MPNHDDALRRRILGPTQKSGASQATSNRAAR